MTPKIDFEGATFEYSQPPDDCDNGQLGHQQIKIIVADAGAGHYFAIETVRWAFDNVEQLSELVGSVRTRLHGLLDDEEATP